MKNKSWITGLLIIILASIAVGIRIYYMNHLMPEARISGELYDAAKVGLETADVSSIFADGFHIRSVYTGTLYFAFLIFGNFAEAGVYLNVLYQVLTVLSVSAVVGNVSNRYIGFGAGLVVAALPVYIGRLPEVTVWNMEIFIATALCALAAFAARMVYNRHSQKHIRKENAGEAEKAAPDSGVAEEPRRKSLWDTSMKEIVPEDLEEPRVQYIENPLPVPKRRKHKEMDFALKTKGSDDFDVKDMSGRDFYDIE